MKAEARRKLTRTYQLSRKSGAKTKATSEGKQVGVSARWPSVRRSVGSNEARKESACNVKRLGLLSLGQ